MNESHWHQTPGVNENPLVPRRVSCHRRFRGVIAVLSSLGVHSLLSRVVVSGLNILSDQQQSDDELLTIILQ